MHKSVKVILILMAGLLIIGNMGFAKKTTKSGNPYNDLLDSMFVSQDKTKWLLQIEKFYIDVDDFSIGYDLFLKQLTPQQKAQMTNNSELRTQYFDNYLNYNVLLVKAIEDNFFNDPENQILLRTAVRQAVAQIYLQKNMPEQSTFMPTKEEIDQFYKENQEKIGQMGLSADQIKEAIVSQLMQRKMQLWMKTFVDTIKEEYRIKRNKQALKKLGLN